MSQEKEQKLKQAQESLNDLIEDIAGIENSAAIEAGKKMFEACAWLTAAADMEALRA